MFDALSDRLSKIFSKLRSKGLLSDADIDATAREIRLALLEADVALPVVKAFISRLKERARGAEVSQALNPAQQVIKIVYQELVSVLGGEARRLRFAKHPPTVIMLAGLQGSGKTTLAAKLGRHLKNLGHQPLLVAADLQRPNAVHQLQILGERAGVEVFAPHSGVTSRDAGAAIRADGLPEGADDERYSASDLTYGGFDGARDGSPAYDPYYDADHGRDTSDDPVRVAYDSIAYAQRHLRDIVIIDTAGRLGVDAEMMAQAAAIRDATQPDEVLFVIDAMVGQDAVKTAEAFRDGVGITGVVLSKLDGDARGGAALSVREVTGAPIMFASTGEGLADFDVFHPDRMASRILGMGDVLTLIEQAEAAFDQEQKERMTAKLAGGESFTLEDFLEQIVAIRRMGPIANMLAMLPGLSQYKDQLAQVDDRQFDQIVAIIRSMTPAERATPKIINGSRRARIAAGSGVTVVEVNQLLNRFSEAQKQMRAMSGMMGLPGFGRKATKSPKNKRKAGKQQRGRADAARPRGGRAAVPGMDPAQLEMLSRGLDGGFTLPSIDFSKLSKRRPNRPENPGASER